MADKLTETVERLRELRRFLDGSGDLDGFSFGEKPAAAPSFWWRKRLVAIDDAIDALTPAGEDVRAARELAEYLPKAAQEAEENGWMQWGADMRQAADLLAALSRPNVDEGVTQADREAAWPIVTTYVSIYEDKDKAAFMEGRYDGQRVIQAFRAHRVAALNGSAS